jgi:hypothetical protein
MAQYLADFNTAKGKAIDEKDVLAIQKGDPYNMKTEGDIKKQLEAAKRIASEARNPQAPGQPAIVDFSSLNK